ncbi:hypothetical protein FB564_1113 [Salinispora arenicola]|uniref:DDE superfamily endonuclease n=2 Tax=Salinispora arenicola TaxID=168697 RepID=A0A542XJK8_SALAC|nr:hypothetical protein FB564_1113 [Salinispora arenicola]
MLQDSAGLPPRRPHIDRHRLRHRQPPQHHAVRTPRDGSPLPGCKHDRNAQHRTVRAQVEHTLARMTCFKIWRDYRRAARTMTDTASGIAHLHNIILARVTAGPRRATPSPLRDVL